MTGEGRRASHSGNQADDLNCEKTDSTTTKEAKSGLCALHREKDIKSECEKLAINKEAIENGNHYSCSQRMRGLTLPHVVLFCASAFVLEILGHLLFEAIVLLIACTLALASCF